MNAISTSVKSAILTSLLILGGCSYKPEHAHAKELMLQFTCPTTNGVWTNLMENNKDKAQKFMENYEKGLHLFDSPIDEVIQMQLNQFKEACESSNGNKSFP